ncbi:thrombospondin-2-like isoform X2 [Ostrea edulis]|uniref:thrombospondin-2-like isoform X2 n=1 Tax=Ostrea edulis TaxID=37623 RepID=UPI0024AEE4ED|nr:thrombospondin-2-like isoform X2 [Ostrea edulis]
MVHNLMDRTWILCLYWISVAACRDAVDGQWSYWTTWGECCLDTQYRSRTCDSPKPEYGGVYCVGDSGNSRLKFTSWSSCSTTCGEGQKRRIVFCSLTEEQASRYGCYTAIFDLVNCSERKCPAVHGNWSLWSPWGACHATACMTMGIQNRTRLCTNPSPDYGGEMCTGDAVESRSCLPCPGYDWEAIFWSGWSPCTRGKWGCYRQKTKICPSCPTRHGLTASESCSCTHAANTFFSSNSEIRTTASWHFPNSHKAQKQTPKQNNHDTHPVDGKTLLIATTIGSVCFIIFVVIIIASVIEYLKRKRLRSTPYRMQKHRFERDMKTIVLFPESNNPVG